MRDDHFLKLGNPHKVVKCLQPLLPTDALAQVEAEIHRNAEQLLRLAKSHLRHAKVAAGDGSWRQKISRGYYAAYIASRAVRLQVKGHYTDDPSDHKKIGALPSNFPDLQIWDNILTQFRSDRNLADYDHTPCHRELEHTADDYLELATRFLAAVHHYLRRRQNPNG
jgi:uncharacterized protein (UPF0332 family)